MAGPGILQALASVVGAGSVCIRVPATHGYSLPTYAHMLPSNEVWGGTGRHPGWQVDPSPGREGVGPREQGGLGLRPPSYVRQLCSWALCMSCPQRMLVLLSCNRLFAKCNCRAFSGEAGTSSAALNGEVSQLWHAPAAGCPRLLLSRLCPVRWRHDCMPLTRQHGSGAETQMGITALGPWVWYKASSPTPVTGLPPPRIQPSGAVRSEWLPSGWDWGSLWGYFEPPDSGEDDLVVTPPPSTADPAFWQHEEWRVQP